MGRKGEEDEYREVNKGLDTVKSVIYAGNKIKQFCRFD